MTRTTSNSEAAVAVDGSGNDDDDALNIIIPPVAVNENEESEAASPGRTSPSVAAAIAVFESGGGTKKKKHVVQSPPQLVGVGKNKPSWQKKTIVTNNKITEHNDSSPSSDAPTSSSINNNEPSSSSSSNKLPIINVLEVENELRKREDGCNLLEKVSEEHNIVGSSENGSEKSYNNNDDGEEEEEGGGVNIAVEGDDTFDEKNDQVDATTEDVLVKESYEDDDIMEMSDSEAGTSSHLVENEDQYEQQQQQEDDEGEEEVWEDFMIQYWQQLPSSSSSSPSLQKQTKTNTNNEDENTDLIPCLIEPILDTFVPLSFIRTGCMDIDMDYSTKATTNDDDEKLSKVGLECSIEMAKFVNENNNNNALGNNKGNNKNGSEKKKNTRDGRGFKIDIGKVIESRSPKKKSKNTISGGQQQQQQQQQQYEVQQNVSSEHDVPLSLQPRLRQDAPTVESSATAAAAAPSQQSMAQDTSFVAAAQLVGTHPHDDRHAIDDKKSTKSSTVGSDVPSQSTSTDWKHKTTPLPSPELINMTGPISTRTSLRSLVMKKWHPSYWMHYGSHSLLIFRSKDHMDDWRYNPYHGKKQRDFLVKLQIDFMLDDDADGEGGGSGGGGASKEGILGHRLLPIKKKSYGKNEDEM